MNTDTGKIENFNTKEELDRAILEAKGKLKAMLIPPTPEQCVRGFVAPNDYCPCGSQKKFKVCCMTLPEKNDAMP